MSEYSRYNGVSPEWTAFESTLPEHAGGTPSPVEMRTAANRDREAQAAQLMPAFASQVETQDFAIPTRDGSVVEARSYRPKSAPRDARLPVYLHLHGGGFLMGTLSSEDSICARTAIATGVVVFNVNYRHTPEHTYPTAWDDADDAFKWLHANIATLGGDPAKVVVGGVSAGAWLAGSLVQQQHLARSAGGADPLLPPIAGQVLLIPALSQPDCGGKKGSWWDNEHAPLLPAAMAQFFTDLLAFKDPQEGDLRLNPGNATVEQVRGMPPTVIITAGMDPLRDHGLEYGKLLAEAGVPTDVSVFFGLPHGFRGYGDKLSASAKWDAVLDEGIRWALGGPAAGGEYQIKRVD